MLRVHLILKLCNSLYSAIFYVFTAMNFGFTIFSVVMPCSDMVGYQRCNVPDEEEAAMLPEASVTCMGSQPRRPWPESLHVEHYTSSS
jgi:hypothetical protein